MKMNDHLAEPDILIASWFTYTKLHKVAMILLSFYNF